MPSKSLLKHKNYDVHSITSATADGRKAANIATWVMQSAMGGRLLTVALYNVDLTIELVHESGLLNVNLLAQDQTRLIRKLGRQSGRTVDKFKNLPFAFDERGVPFLTESVGYVACAVVDSVASGDHTLFVCAVVKQVILNPGQVVMTNDFLKKKGLVRG